MPRIYEQKHGSLSEGERYELGRLLLKAGYTVTIGKERPPGKETGRWIGYVDYGKKAQEGTEDVS